MRGLMLLAILLAITPLIWIIIDVIKMGVGAIHGLSFFTKPAVDPTSPTGGIANGIIGTLIMVGLAALIAVPLGILGAIYLSEFSFGSRFSRTVRFFADVMTGVPSIVVGIFVFALLVLGHSFSAFSGAVALAFIMWPIVLRTAEEVIRLVPHEIREASYALGVPKWKTVLKVVLPTAAGGLVTGSMLAVARVSGETAPLLFTALGNNFTTTRLSDRMSGLPQIIFNGATSAYDVAQKRAWAGALTLIVLILLLTLGSRALFARRARAV